MSSNAPSMPLFGDAYLADTRHLSLEEHGAYLQLMIIAWRTPDCALPDDDARLARMLGITAGRWAKLKPTVMAFWTLTETGWTQKRLSKERAFVDGKRAKNKAAAESRWEEQPVENKQVDECERTSERNAPPPPPPLVPSEAKASSVVVVRATRIPAGWVPGPLPSKVHDLAVQWPPGRLERELDGFRDYWAARVRDAARNDWDRTWHNRIRDQHDRVMREARNGGSGKNFGSNQDRRDGVARALDRRLGFDDPPPDGYAAGGGGAGSGSPVARLAALR